MDPYIPNILPFNDIDYRRILPFVGGANAMIGRYDGLLQGVLNPAVMLSPLTNEEAVLSSKIEGTQATVDEVLEQEAGMIKEGKKFHDIQEIINYRKALLSAQKVIEEEHPISLYLIRELHKILLDSVRGQDKNPGEFRKEQNWIGSPGCKMENATFIPPNPMQLDLFLQNWEKYVAGNDIDVLIQASIVHAQFELLHPFKDGNGRIGRILIPLFLFQKKALSKPMFYLSSYLESNREEYYHKLKGISEENDWNSWIEFFLKATMQQAEDNGLKVKNIIRLYEDMKGKIHNATHSQYIIQILDALFFRPIFKATDFTARTGIAKATSLRYLKQLKDSGILRELSVGSGSKGTVFCFPDLLNIAEGKKAF